MLGNFRLQALHILFLFPFTQQLNLHALFEKREWLRKVADAELVLRLLFGILHAEVEPLLVTLRVRVHLAVQIIFLKHCLPRGPRHLDELVI